MTAPDDGNGTDGASGMAVARRAALQLGAASEDARLLRVGTSTLVVLAEAGLLLRVDDPTRRAAADRQVAVATALARAAVPAARLATVAAHQPIAFPDGVVTVWELLDIRPGPVPPEGRAQLLRALHDRTRDRAPGDEPPLPALDPFGPIADQLARARRAERTRADDLARLEEALAEAAGTWDALRADDPLGRALVHGDGHGDNLVATTAGPVLVDLELSGDGPPSYDLAAQLVAVERYGRPEAEFVRFTATYGHDLRTWSGCTAFCRLYALWATAWAVAHRDLGPDLDHEAEIRLRWWRDPSDRVAWTLR